MSGASASRDLTQGPVRDHLLRFILPMSVALVANMTTGLVDAFWLGRVGTVELAAVSFAFPVAFATFAIAIGLSSGAVAVVSRAVGVGDRERVRRITTDALLLGAMIAAVAALLGVLAVTPLFTALGASGELLVEIRRYMSIWYLGLIFMMGPIIAGAIMRALGDAVFASAFMGVTAIVNLVLDPLLIFGVGPFPRMEVAGAALATVLASAVSFAVAAGVMIFREKLIAFRAVAWRDRVRHWREIAHVGVPAMISTGINPVAMVIVVAAVARYGEAAVAGFGVAARVESLAAIPLFALSAAMPPMTGQNAGAGRPDRVRDCFRASFQIAVVWSGVTALVLMAFGGAIAGLFINPADPAAEEVRAVVRDYLLIVPVTTWGYGVVMAGSAGFNGLSRPITALTMTVGRSIVALAPAAWLGGALMGAATGVFWGMAAANVAAGLITAGWILRRAYPPATAAAGAAE
ncbi:MAG: MATE family efflux transporter [Caulobacterales bacterium]|nr:MATE family efflux transporter [Caulobacterales bacterium]